MSFIKKEGYNYELLQIIDRKDMDLRFFAIFFYTFMMYSLTFFHYELYGNTKRTL